MTQHEKTTQQNPQHSQQNWPRDFDFRAEAAEQQEIVQQAPTRYLTPPLTCSDYDFS